jgi:predicted transcriptional regulator
MTTDVSKGEANDMKTVGDQELALLRDIAECGPSTVGEVAERFGEPRGLARSTVLTMMERLRQKGHLERKQVDGVYRYALLVSEVDLLRGAVQAFVEKTLAGSVSPFVAYLTETGEVSDAELAQLEHLVARLKSRKQEG